ncbi:MAG TPA: hypothetical protein VIA81_04055 [Acidimicrobiia bacterium]
MGESIGDRIDHRQREILEGSGGSLESSRRERGGAAAGNHQAGDARGAGRASDGTEIARVENVIEDDQRRSLRRGR